MPSLNDILAREAPLLVIDAASSRIQVGVLGAGGAGLWETSDEEAGIGIFRCVEALGADIGSIRAFAFCSGPGSILGIRTVAMALRVWEVEAERPIYAYSSLALVSQALGKPEAAIIADARRDTWHVCQLGAALRRVPTSDLPGNLLMPEGFRQWSALPSSAFARTPYGVAALLALPQVAGADLFQPAAAPDAFLHDEPAYATWTPQVHRAP